MTTPTPSPHPEGALTVSRLVDEVLGALHGYVRDQAVVTTLVTDMSDTDLVGTVDEKDQLSRGLAEIDEELIYVSKVDRTSVGGFTIPTWGRGQEGTTPTPHLTGTKVTMSPLYPRRRVRDAIFWVLREIFPKVYGVSTALFDVDVIRTNYPLPPDCWQVFTVEWNLPGPTFMWQPMKRWRVNHTSTTQELEMLGMRWPGPNRARAVYSKNPPTTYDLEDLTAYGYEQTIHDILILGATARLLSLTEPSRLQVESVESHGRSEVVQGGTITQVAKTLHQMFERRVEQEAFRLQQRYTLQPHKVR